MLQFHQILDSLSKRVKGSQVQSCNDIMSLCCSPLWCPQWRGSHWALPLCGSPRTSGQWSCSSPICASTGAQGCSGQRRCSSLRDCRWSLTPSDHWSPQSPSLGWKTTTFTLWSFQSVSYKEWYSLGKETIFPQSVSTRFVQTVL